MRKLIFFIFIIISVRVFSQDISLPDTIKSDTLGWLLKQAKKNYSSKPDLADSYSRMAVMLAQKQNKVSEIGLAYKYMGITNYFRHNYTAALEYYKKSISYFQQISEYKEIANTNNNIAIIFAEERKFDSAIFYNHRALDKRKKLNDAEGIIGSYNNIGNLYLTMGNYDDAFNSYLKAKEIADLVLPEQHFPNLKSSLADMYSKKGEVYKAISLYEESIKEFKDQNNLNGLIVASIKLSGLYFDSGSTDKSIEILIMASELVENAKMDYYMAVVQLNIGNIYYLDEQYENALNYYQMASKKYKASKDTIGEIKSLINISLCHRELINNDSALIAMQQANNLAKFKKDTLQLAETSNYMGNIYIDLAEFKQAKKYLERAFFLAGLKDNNVQLYKANYYMGVYYFKQKYYLKAIPFFEKSAQIANDISNIISQKNSWEYLYLSYENVNDFKNAFKALKQYNIREDSVFNKEKQQQIVSAESRLNLKYKQEKINAQNEIINAQTEIISKDRTIKIIGLIIAVLSIGILILIISRLRISRQKEKAILSKQNLQTELDLLQMQMNPHFIFNALNSIQSFVSENNSLQAEIYLSKFARLIRYYLEKSSESFVSFKEELDALKLNLELERLRLNNKFEDEVEIDDNIDVEELMVPPLLIQPFVENAIKHGIRPKPEKGKISIGFKLSGEFIFCFIEDNGVGRKPVSENKKHVSKGVYLSQQRLNKLSKSNKKSNRIKIIDLKDKNSLPSGTRVEIYIPYEYF